MKLHLVNGFLGSGKTTAIIAAARRYIQQGKTVAIVTNDKGRYQVDAAFFQAANIPTGQVAGGCFRCSFNEFKEQIAYLSHSAHPDILFAESVGSCVDLVNTVFPPLLSLPDLQIAASTFTVFTDIRLFRRWLYGEPMPFSDSIVYTFGKQIDETQMLVLNKMDLLPLDVCHSIYEEASRRFPEKRVMLQNSLKIQEELPWFAYLNESDQVSARTDFQVDYTQYMDAEKKMAWFDQVFTIRPGGTGNIRQGVLAVIANLLQVLCSQMTPVTHLKFFISNVSEKVKLSFTAMDLMPGNMKEDWRNDIPHSLSGPVRMIINARVEMKSQRFKEVVDQAIQHASISEGVKIIPQGGSLYHPEVLPSVR